MYVALTDADHFTNRASDMLFTRECADQIQLAINHLGTLRLTPDELEWLRTSCAYLREPYLSFLREFALRPAEQVQLCYTPVNDTHGTLGIDIRGAWKDVILYEVPVMAIISETYFAMCDTDWRLDGQREQAYRKGRDLLEHGIVLSEFGTRRRRSLATHDAVMDGLVQAHKDVQAAHLPKAGRLLGTSNVYLAKKYGLVPSGTIAHEWTMGIATLMGYEHSNLHALLLWDKVYQPPAFTPAQPSEDLTIALTDTFSTKVFWEDITSNPLGSDILKRWRGLRQDSGDSGAFVQHALDMYRKMGIDPSTKLVIFSDGLNVSRCKELQRMAEKCGIRAGFGVGTNLTNDFCRVSDGTPSRALNMVIKLSSVQGKPAIKISDDLTKNTGDPDEVAYVQL